MKLNSVTIIDRGLKCLSDNLGSEEAELFVFTLLSEKFDYTEWRRTLVDQIETEADFDEFIKKHYDSALYGGDPDTII